MTRTRTRTSKPKRRDGGLREPLDQLHKDMKELTELQKAQEIRFVPEVPDVPRMRLKKDRVFSFDISYSNTYTLNTMSPTGVGLSFQLSNSTLAGSFTSVFDRYRIVQANVKILPVGVSSSGGNAIYSVIDYDDANAPTVLGPLLAYDTLKITPTGQIEERTLTPRFATAAYSGAFTSYANMGMNTWIDAASPSVQYYGVKIWTSNAAPSSSLTVVVTMTVQFKSQHG